MKIDLFEAGLSWMFAGRNLAGWLGGATSSFPEPVALSLFVLAVPVILPATLFFLMTGLLIVFPLIILAQTVAAPFVLIHWLFRGCPRD